MGLIYVSKKNHLIRRSKWVISRNAFFVRTSDSRHLGIQLHHHSTQCILLPKLINLDRWRGIRNATADVFFCHQQNTTISNWVFTVYITAHTVQYRHYFLRADNTQVIPGTPHDNSRHTSDTPCLRYLHRHIIKCKKTLEPKSIYESIIMRNEMKAVFETSALLYCLRCQIWHAEEAIRSMGAVAQFGGWVEISEILGLAFKR